MNVPLKASQARMERIERFANGLDLSSCASAAVSKETKTIAWYVHATFDSDQSNLVITHCKVDRAHPGKGLGGLLLEATEANVGIDKCIASFTATLVFLETNAAARKCNEKAGFKEYGRSNSAFSPIVCPQKIQWLGMSGAVASFSVSVFHMTEAAIFENKRVKSACSDPCTDSKWA